MYTFPAEQKAMETSGSSSQTRDHGQVHGETEDLDYGEMDFHKQDGEAGLFSQGPYKRDKSSSASSSSSSSSSSLSSSSASGAEHGEPDVLKDELQLYGGVPGEVVPSGESGLRRRGSDPANDEFFHFVLLCFAIGALLVCYHYYADWFMSLGIGLLTFASLETIGIYFGLVYRIHSILQGFIPLFQKLRLMDGETDSKRFSNLLKCPQQVSSRAAI
ncbi:transmembrane protein 40 isoform X3 [Diceros bicornis minor]|uniref:transmembrane protein 40 isoform X3 n=1 Tax=Diceros bicornis minor TaxID=77932 RepID=UPI0026EE4274|nr:transmembrane protein 40 isoform X3 [Diceros bicornis minor]